LCPEILLLIPSAFSPVFVGKELLPGTEGCRAGNCLSEHYLLELTIYPFLHPRFLIRNVEGSSWRTGDYYTHVVQKDIWGKAKTSMCLRFRAGQENT